MNSIVERVHKGSSLLKKLSDYTVVDIETTGLDPKRDEIIEIAALRVRGNVPVGEFSTLVKPSYPITHFISSLTGITNDMLHDAPTVQTVLPILYKFLGNDVIVGHNVNFDMNFLYDNFLGHMQIPFCNDYIDTLRISRRLLALPNYKLASIAGLFSVSYEGAHRALADCYIEMQCYEQLSGSDEETLCELCSKAPGSYVKKKDAIQYFVRAACIEKSYEMDREDCIFYERVCVFTGALEHMTRAQAVQTVVNLGGICTDVVSKNTNFLVLGNFDYRHVKDGKSSKLKKAEDLILRGHDLCILSEDVFLQQISYVW